MGTLLLIRHGQASYGDQPVGWDVAGSLETVEGLTREDMTGHVGAWYVPNNMVLSVAGQIDHETVMAAARSLFRRARFDPAHPSPTSPIRNAGTVCAAAGAGPAISRHHRRQPDIQTRTLCEGGWQRWG